MTVIGETLLTGAPDVCLDCQSTISPVCVMRSYAGYYIGTYCPSCGPYSRESGYFKDRKDAQRELQSYVQAIAGDGAPPESARTTEFQGLPQSFVTGEKV